MSTTRIVRGLPFPKSTWLVTKNIEAALDHVPHDGDIIIASYPKTGTTWLQYIVIQIISKGQLFPSFNDCLYKYAPFLEMVGTAVLENLEEPRVYKHHIPYNMVQKNKKAKCIYPYRRPEDTVVSYYHFMHNLGREIPELDEYFEDFLSGNVAYGHYFDHLTSYFAHKDDENLLLVSYEKLWLNPRQEILRIAKYLGEEYYRSLSENDSIMDKVLEHTSFDYMKKNLCYIHTDDKGEVRKANFFRKGVIGDGKRSLKADQLERLKDLAMKRLEGTDLIKEWFEE